MKLSSQKDLLLVITISGAVLILNWLGLLKGSELSTLLTIFALFLPGYAMITAIWLDDESMGWTMRAGVGFVLGLIFVLFLPLIFNSLNWGYLDSYLYSILFILAILFSILAMVRRSEGEYEEEVLPEEGQITLEESIERAALLRQQADVEADEYEDYYYDEEYPEEGYSEEEITGEEYDEDGLAEDEHFTEKDYPLDESGKKIEDLEKEKSLQYERVEDFQKGEEYPSDDELTPPEKSRVAPFKIEEPTTISDLDYEAEMDKPVWAEEPPEKKSGFKNWDMAMILFLTGISLLFLYFNPLKTTSTSIIFFILLLFIMGYAGLTIVFPDKSRTSTRNLLLGSTSIAIVLFILSFLAWRVEILPNLPKFIVRILFVASVLLSAGAFIRKWQVTHKDEAPTKEAPEEPVPEPVEEVREQKEIPTVEETLDIDEVPGKKAKEEVLEKEFKEKKDPLAFLKTLGTSETTEIADKKEIHQEPPTFKPRNHYLDIIIVAAITLLTVAFVLIPPLNKTFIRTILGVLLVLFIPGYSLIAALFPKWGDLDGIERAALSFGLSIAVTPLIGLALNYTPWGIRLDPILVSLTIFTLAMATIAFLRRRRLPDEEKFFVPFGQFTRNIRESFKGESRTERILSIILIVSIVLAIATTAYVIVKPKEGEKFTEFYILGPDGKASNYPTNLTTGQNGSLIMGVVNHEYTTTDYLLVIKVNNNTLKNQTLTLSSGEKVEIPYNFTAGTTGQKKMEFLLYKLPDNATAYRSLHLWLNVK
ncbi:DUF1616 domain-containing protein [Methanobacterium sp. BAmetb5]|uniref:DUF1616 domain-containing protein n=1 Tax=Methanobacterium sp. BAmetb5 TaxID=2025351 RepID=UPI000E88A84A|nr:DUF1616 domain-containing protein [Methanobacterium sp. BAmetb5]AXV38896.1 MAG: hypothetical protein CIT02_00510 [Methanobacterium sp. BAmetb5]